MSCLAITPEEMRQSLRETLNHPVSFARQWLRDDLWPVQEQILQSVAANPRTAVKACHASGKTFTAAAAVLWSLARWSESIIVTTAPTWNQVERLLWSEIRRAIGRSPYPFPKPHITELKIGPKRYAMGLSTAQGEEGVRFQGFHAEHILMVLDEAPGIHPKIWEAIEGARAGGDVRILALGNPTIPSGPFHEAFTSNRQGWATFTISAFDTPNLAGLDVEALLKLSEDELSHNVRPYLTTRRWVKEKYREWGPGHPLWESRVLGHFPAQAEDSLLSLAWLEAAQHRAMPAEGKIRAGLDVAGPGEDETVLTIRQGPKVLLQQSWSAADPRGEVVAALSPHKEQLELVNVDSIGIGWGMYLHLCDVFGKGIIHAVNVGGQARDSEKYANLKAELYWGLRLRAQSGQLANLPEACIGQLAGIRYRHNARGQVWIESKEDARKRGVKSPDKAESVMLAFAETKRSQFFEPISVTRQDMDSFAIDPDDDLTWRSPWRI